MASIRENRPGYWEVRVFVGYDDEGKPVQVSKAIRGGKRDAERLAATTTMRTYAHALEGLDQGIADTVAAVLDGDDKS